MVAEPEDRLMFLSGGYRLDDVPEDTASLGAEAIMAPFSIGNVRPISKAEAGRKYLLS